MNNISINDFVKSWYKKRGIYSLAQILSWIDKKNRSLKVKITKIPLEKCEEWEFDKKTGSIRRKNSGFFSIIGIKQKSGNKIIEQPIIIQKEIGFLGIIVKKINGVLHFLMQAKIEPGNINKIQISPTIQATKSNFTQVHGGKKPAYLDFFIKPQSSDIILVDQLQSEQSSRFIKKRNRNIIIYTNRKIKMLPSHIWMTLGQIKKLMRFDNLVNMDTRTVLSCLPFFLFNGQVCCKYFKDQSLLNSLTNPDYDKLIPSIYNILNNVKMFSCTENKIVPLSSLMHWKYKNGEFFSNRFPFKVVFADISIEQREVKRWNQPLFESLGTATFCLFTRIKNNTRFFLIKTKIEIGAFDTVEFGPTIQRECGEKENDRIDTVFKKYIKQKRCVLCDVLLSEEGGRFYHEQNRNIILEISKELDNPPEGYIWVTLRMLNLMVLSSNVLNIQLRNLIALLAI